jgi:hypothetical protein
MIVRVGGGLTVEVLVMPVLRKIPVWIVLASYLFANTVASSLHDHRDCCGHSDGVDHQSTACAAVDNPRSAGAKCCHHKHGHRHDAVQHHASCRTRPGHALAGHSPTGHPSSHPAGRENDGSGRHDSHRCVVCDFLALAPLSVPQATLELAGEILPEFVDLHVLPVSETTVETHLARGPPAA